MKPSPSFQECTGIFLALLILAVDFLSRRFAFRGAFCEPPRSLRSCARLASTLIPQESTRLQRGSTKRLNQHKPLTQLFIKP